MKRIDNLLSFLNYFNFEKNLILENRYNKIKKIAKELNLRSSFLDSDITLALSYLATNLNGLILEFGVLDGWSTASLALSKNEVKSYDLFENYKYKSGNRDFVYSFIKKCDLDKNSSLIQKDIFEITPTKCKLLFIDLSNTGEILEMVIDNWFNYADIIAFEGGTTERDTYPWMLKYKKKPIRDAIKNFSNKYKDILVYEESFPGITFCLK